MGFANVSAVGYEKYFRKWYLLFPLLSCVVFLQVYYSGLSTFENGRSRDISPPNQS